MRQPQNIPRKYEHLFSDIDMGRIKIPKFQREFVWSKENTAKLIDSIIKGFPIGTFIFWNTTEQLRHIKNIGNIDLPEIEEGQQVSYVLDGQQRITSLYALRKGIRITKDGTEIDYQDIYIDLSADPDAEDEIVFTDEPKSESSISVYRLLSGSLTSLISDFSTSEIGKIEIYQKRLTGYDFSTIVIDGYPIDIACEVFTRINTGGQELTMFEIMVAKTYDESKDFDLAREYDELVDSKSGEKDLEDADFDTIPSSTVLQCISAHLAGQVKGKDILKLNKAEFIEAWPDVKEAIFLAVDYFRDQLSVPVSRLLPYNQLLVPFTYFFLKNDLSPPTTSQTKWLVQYFWWASLSRRFYAGVDSKIEQDLRRMDVILDGNQPDYKNDEVKIDVDTLRFHGFSASDAFNKAILCLFASFTPRSFASNSNVRLNNSYLKAINSKNYHHFFPRAYLKKNGFEDWQANSIVNITLVDDYLNKRRIGAKAPSTYISEFEAENSEIAATLKTHLIDDIKGYGIKEDEYEVFLDKRAGKIVSEISKRLNPV